MKKRQMKEYPEIRAELNANNALTSYRCEYISGLDYFLPGSLCQMYANKTELRIISLSGRQIALVLNMAEVTNFLNYKEIIPSFPFKTTEFYFSLKYKNENIVFRYNSRVVRWKDVLYNGKSFRSQNFFEFMQSQVAIDSTETEIRV